MFGNKHNQPQNHIDSLIGASTKIEGNLSFSGGLRIDGEVTGNIVATPGSPSTLVLSEHGRVNGEINVTHLMMNGVVVGTVRANEYLELQSKARVTGDVYYRTLEIQLGAVINARLFLMADAVAEKLLPFKQGDAE